MTHAQRNLQRKRAAREAAATGPGQSMAGATSYELQLAKLLQDRLRLKQIQSQEGKAKLKQQLLPEYAAYVAGVLQGGHGAQDEVLTTVMVWRIDAGDYAGALDIAAYVLQHGLKMPDHFERTPGCLIPEEIAEAALKEQKAGGNFDLIVLERTEKLTAEQDMPDEVRAKLLLALGRSHLAAAESHVAAGESQHVEAHLDMAIQRLRRAIELHGSCGAKKDLERAERLLKKHAPNGAEPDPQGQGDAPAEG